MLETDDVGICEIEEVRGPQVRVDFLLLDLESHLAGIVVPLGNVVDRDHETIRPGILSGDRSAQIIRKCRYAAFPRQIIAHKRDLLDLGVSFHIWPEKPKLVSTAR